MLNIKKTNELPIKGALHSRISNLSFITLAMLGVLVCVFVAASIIVPRFFSIHTMANLLVQQSELIIIGIGVTFIIITGRLDLSVGGVVALSAVLVSFFSQATTRTEFSLASGLGFPYWFAVILTLLCCMCIGAINAFFIVKMKIASIIVTLGGMSLARGIAMIIARGAQRNVGLPPEFRFLGRFTVVGTINLSVIIMLVLFLIALFVEKKTIFGRNLFLIGANKTAADLSGIKTGKQIVQLYILSAFLAGITGVLMASKFCSGSSSLATGYEFDALVITVLGGTSIQGGFGSVFCAVIGAFILGILSTSVNMLGFPPASQLLVRGFVIVIAILAQRYALNKRNV